MSKLVCEVGDVPVKFPRLFVAGLHVLDPGGPTSFQRSAPQVADSKAIKINILQCFSSLRGTLVDRSASCSLLRLSFGRLAAAAASIPRSISSTCPLDILETAEHAFRHPQPWEDAELSITHTLPVASRMREVSNIRC